MHCELSLTIDYYKLTIMQSITTGLRTIIGSNIRNGIRCFSATLRTNHELGPHNIDYKQLTNNMMNKSQNVCTVLQKNIGVRYHETIYEKKSLKEMLYDTKMNDSFRRVTPDPFYTYRIYTGRITQYYDYDKNTDVWTKHKQLLISSFMDCCLDMNNIIEFAVRKQVYNYVIPHICSYFVNDMCDPRMSIENRDNLSRFIRNQKYIIDSLCESGPSKKRHPSVQTINISLVNYIPFPKTLSNENKFFREVAQVFNILTKEFSIPNGKILITQPHYGHMLIDALRKFAHVRTNESTIKIIDGMFVNKTSYLVKINHTTFEFII